MYVEILYNAACTLNVFISLKWFCNCPFDGVKRGDQRV